MSQPTKRYILDDPIIFERRTEKDTSPATRDALAVERHLSRAMHRTIHAADKGMTRYRKARRRSAEKQDDGPLVDFIPNVLRGSAVAMRELSVVPFDLLRAAYTPQVRKITRRTIRSLTDTADDMLD